MKAIYAIALMLVSFSVLAQNGGQANEHASLKIEYKGHLGGSYLADVTNKLCDSANVTLSWPNHSDSVIRIASGTIRVALKGAYDSTGKVRAMTNHQCPAGGAFNAGWVESLTNFAGTGVGLTLPVTILKTWSEKIEDRTYRVYITLLNPDGDSKLWVRISKDGAKTFRRFPIHIEQSNEPKTYSYIITTKQ